MKSSALRITVGITALVAPFIHSMTDALEWYQHGFSVSQLWLNYIAFVPMSWLLLGLYAVHEPAPGALGLIGALLYGAAFTYFSHTTLFALYENVSTYEELWRRLGGTYTVHGALMVCGGLLFAWSALRAKWLPRFSVLLFLAGIIANLVLSYPPTPDILQTIGSAARNAGLVAMGYFVLFNDSPLLSSQGTGKRG
jgi:hypothetical protein